MQKQPFHPESGHGTKLWYLKRIPLLKELSRELLDQIARHSVERQFREGEHIFLPADAPSVQDRVYLLKQGKVRLYRGVGGRRIVLETLEGGSIFGGFSLMHPTRTDEEEGNFAVCEEDTHLCVMSRSDFLDILKQRPDIALNFIQEMAQRMHVLEDRFQDVALLDAKSRIVNELWRLGKKQDDETVRIPRITHERLAERLGLSREAVSRAITELRESGEVQQDPETGEFLMSPPRTRV